MELDDNEFDAAFRKRVFDADPEFEEAAWNKMEGKLRRRDRIVLFRKVAGTLSVLLLLGLTGYYSFDWGGEKKTQPQLAEQGKGKIENGLKNGVVKPENKQNDKKTGVDTLRGTVVAENKEIPLRISGGQATERSAQGAGGKERPAKENIKQFAELIQKNNRVTTVVNQGLISVTENGRSLTANTLPALLSSSIRIKPPFSSDVPALLSSSKIVLNPVLVANTTEKTASVQSETAAAGKKAHSGEQKERVAEKKPFNIEKKKPLLKRPVPMSLALTLGPEFNSAGAAIGGKTGFNAGLSFSMGVAKKIKLETGLKYSMKDYATNGYAYRWNNPAMSHIVANIDAACAVLEIPVRASYTVFEDFQRSVDLNLGLSSYLMLRENYTFRYTPEAQLADRVLEKINANQHFLSVIDVSATYFIRLKSEKFKIGVEPFLKIPLTGIGEGSVNLKSSGISLKVRYDLDRKH